MPNAVSTMPPCLMLPASWKTWVPRDRPMPEFLVRLRSARHDGGHGRQRQHVVDDGGLAEESLERGQRRLGAHDGALALKTFEHRGFFTADVRTSADADEQVEVV